MNDADSIRKAALAARRKIPEDECIAQSAEIFARVCGLNEIAQARWLLSYVSLPDEVDTIALLTWALAQGKRVAVPSVASEGRSITASELLRYPEDLERGEFGLLVPRKECFRPVDPKVFDAQIVPGVAFDLRGHRLGFGKGFYDRFLPTCRPDCVKIGLAFEAQIFDTIPSRPHDVAMDLLVTEKRILDLRHSRRDAQ